MHGRDERLRAGMFDFLRSLDLNPLEWSRAVALTGKSAPYIGEILNAAFSQAQAVVVLFSPDDLARLRPDLCGKNEPPHEVNVTHQARPNVLFEAGMAMARHPDRTVLVEIGVLRPFSDIGGRHTIRMDNSTKKRQEIAQRLRVAGCPVNLSGTDW
ncbi:MAG: nucleotide-binding protein [Candidatus Sulfotelmatobacter sp.]